MRLSLLFILPLLLTTWHTSFAATVDDCSKINTSAERLACFDSISKQNEPPVSAKQESKWEHDIYQSEWDDSISPELILLSDNQLDKGVNDAKYGILQIVCLRKTMAVFVSVYDFSTDTLDFFEPHGLESGSDYEFVRYRLDKEQAKGMQMRLQKTRRALDLQPSEQSMPFIKEMFGHDKMLLEIDRSGRGLTTLEFSINGLEEAIKPLRKACKW